MPPAPGEVTRLLAELRAGNPAAEAELVPLVYEDLRRLAARHMRGERPGHTLQPTALVHEAYARLIGHEAAACQNRAHFLRVASRLMREILVDYARTRDREKRGGKHEKLPVDQVQEARREGLRKLLKLENSVQVEDLIALNDALQALGQLDARLERVVDMRFFGGLTEDEIAEALGISLRTVKRDWELARAWLYDEIHGKAESKT
jgi:RNA polymerase sigma factor (TIGR02999 family)